MSAWIGRSQCPTGYFITSKCWGRDAGSSTDNSGVAQLHRRGAPSFQDTARIGPPLAGRGWVAANGCCGTSGVHRASSLSVNGGIYFAQRFAIDWMSLDSEGRMVHGDAGTFITTPVMALTFWRSLTVR